MIVCLYFLGAASLGYVKAKSMMFCCYLSLSEGPEKDKFFVFAESIRLIKKVDDKIWENRQRIKIVSQVPVKFCFQFCQQHTALSKFPVHFHQKQLSAKQCE